MTDLDGAGQQATGELPHCYRHPDVETGVRCTRCDRPICPACMNSAAVGFQCPECVRSGAATVRKPRTAFGGLMPTKAGQVTWALIAINIVTFVIQQSSNTFTDRYDLRPIGPMGTPYAGIAHGQYYRLITSAFLHANVLHILFNMYALFVVGPTLEVALGRARFIVLYLLSALGGSTFAYLLMAPQSTAVGASGAIFGLFGALFVVTRRLGTEVTGIAALIVINLVFSFTVSGISWQGHVGGLVTGTVVAAAFAYAPRDQRNLVQWGTCAITLLVLIAVVAARTHALTG